MTTRRAIVGSRNAQLLNFFLAEVTIDTISSDEVPKFIRRNILGADFLAALSDLVLDAAASDTARVHEFFRAASRTARTYPGILTACRDRAGGGAFGVLDGQLRRQ